MANPLLSSPFEPAPTSTAMMRKRTWQDLDPSTPATAAYSAAASSSSPFLSTSFDSDSAPQNGFLSSPPTLYSSPMGRSVSAQSTFSTFTQSLSSPKKADLSPPVPRPGMKRRRTIAETDSPKSPIKVPESPAGMLEMQYRGGNHNGEDVWPKDVEDAFHTALRLLPRLGRKKLIINGKACGRNELIGDYIFRNTGKMRSRKQVSSHIQVLKNMKKDDKEFMSMVAEPIEGEDRFAPGNARLFFGDAALDSPYMSTFLEHSLTSRGDHVYPPPIDLSATLQLPPLPHPGGLSPHSTGPVGLNSPFVMHSPHGATTPTSTLTRQLNDLTVVASPASPLPVPASLPFSPAEFCMQVDAAEGSRRDDHVYVKLENRGGPSNRVYLDDLPEGQKRYPALASMIERLPCQFVHVKLNLDVPTASTATGLGSKMQSYLRLDTAQALPLTAVTTIFCHGDEIINFSDPLSSPMLIDKPGKRSSGRASPPSPPGQPLRHKYSYHVPFSAEYWTFLLRGGPAASQHRRANQQGDFGRSGKDRLDLTQNLGMFSVVQEFVVAREDSSATPYVPGHSLSRGSALGDVVLVVAYDLAVCEGPKKGVAELSLLSVQHAPPPPPQQLQQQQAQAAYPFLPFLPVFPSTLPAAPQIMRSATSPPSIAVDPPSLAMPPPPLPATARAHHSPVKPNLSLHIPPPAQFVRRSSTGSATRVAPSPGLRTASMPHTPWGQVVHTPAAPPPLGGAMAASPAHRERLEHAWRQNATASDWDMHSPALMGVSAPPESFPTLQPVGQPIPMRPPPMSSSMPSPHLPQSFSPSSFDVGSAFDDAVAFSPLAAPPGALTAMTASAGSLPTPVYSTFPPPNGCSPDLPGSPFLLHDHLGQQQHQQHEPHAHLYGSHPSPVPDFVPMSATSSSTGSTMSSTSVRTLPNAPPTAEASKPADKQKMEQDYFSSLLGSSTKYTGVYC
ncbi:hypothetical protein JCM6882_000323 [Rhodosporidiobolus microsporus]